MNRIVTTAIVMLILAPAAPSGEAISKQDRDTVVKYLMTTRDQVIAETEKLSDAQWNFKAGPDRWSVGEVVEHLALAENFLAEARQKAMDGPAATAEQLAKAKGQDAVILKAIPDRTKKVQAPEPIQPKQRLGPREKVAAAYREPARATRSTTRRRRRMICDRVLVTHRSARSTRTSGCCSPPPTTNGISARFAK